VTRDEALASLKRSGSRRHAAALVRYGIVAPRAFGVPMAELLKLAKRIGKDHALAATLWKSGWLEARFLAAMVDEPARVTRRQMDAWSRAFDNWAVCDTVCWHLFDYTPFAFQKARQWARSPREFVKRAAFAMMAGQAAHNKAATDAQLLALLPLVERGARDERNFVKKGVSWALRRLGGRSPALYEASIALSRRLAASEDASSRWVGKDALRDLSRPLVRARVARSAKRVSGR
jgi:3-methyladenine DNA glycosylase AlkD